MVFGKYLAAVAIYTVALVAASYAGGRLSDRLGRRRVFVAVATVAFAIGLIALASVTTIGQFYVVEAIMGAAFGLYVGVDMALIIDVLPDPEEAAKDLGVFNIANALGATAVALGLGLSLDEAVARLRDAPQVSGRMERLAAEPLIGAVGASMLPPLSGMDGRRGSSDRERHLEPESDGKSTPESIHRVTTGPGVDHDHRPPR